MNIKEMRINRGYSQAELARLSGINLRSLQDYEQGHKSIASAKSETLYRLSQILEYSMEDILADMCLHIEVDNGQKTEAAERALQYEKALLKRKNQVVYFPVIVQDDVVNMSRVYPTKQRMVKAVRDRLVHDSRVQRVRLFGSSITMRCNRDSDLDFSVALNEITISAKNEISEIIQMCCDWGADIVWLDRLSPADRIYEEVMKGLVIV